MLGIGLMLFCLRGIKPHVEWNERLLNVSFWSFNVGLVGMSLMTLLPLGTMQLVAAIENGYWYARSAEFMQRPIVDLIVWMRVPGDVIFSIGGLALALFVLRLWVAPRQARDKLSVGTEMSA
jgi:nitric oxide reductase subunit B